MKKQVTAAFAVRWKIAVIGVGGIGSTFAFNLARHGGHEVTVVARPSSLRLQQLTRDAGIVKSTGEHVVLRVSDHLDIYEEYDLVLVTLLAHQVFTVLPALQRSAARRILFMFNNFEPERLLDFLGPERCAFGMPFVQASLQRDGRLIAEIGVAGQKCKLSSEELVGVFRRAALPAVVEPHMLLWLRCHVPLGAAFESVSIAGARLGRGASWSRCLTVARGMQESFTLIQRLGFRVYPSGKAFLWRCPSSIAAGLLWTLSRIRSFRELLAKAESECCALVDTLVVNAKDVLPPASVATISAMKPSSADESM